MVVLLYSTLPWPNVDAKEPLSFCSEVSSHLFKARLAASLI